MIRLLLDIYSLILIADAVLSYFPDFRRKPFANYIRKTAEFTCRPVRQFLPPDMPFDPSPMIVILLIQIIKSLW